jgi:hypothetical protein
VPHINRPGTTYFGTALLRLRISCFPSEQFTVFEKLLIERAAHIGQDSLFRSQVGDKRLASLLTELRSTTVTPPLA